MSSTSNAQDLLVNVFRPTYNWSSNTGFVPSIVVSNVSELIAGRVKADKLAVTDAQVNSYIGSNAGPNEANLTTRENTAIGYSAMAGASNSSNNVSIGASNFSGLSNGISNVGVGANTLITGTGQKNVLIGTNIRMGDGSGNIIIGNDLSLGNISKTFRLGSLLYGDLSSGYVGINTSRPEAALDISGVVVFRNKVGFQNPNPTYSLDVAGSVFASEQIIGSNGTFTDPLFTFKDASGTGMYVPASGAGFGTGAFGIAVNRSPAAVFSSNQVNFYQNLDVSGTFSARGVVLDGFAVQDGTAAVPTMTFENDSSSGLFLVGTDRIGVSTDGLRRMEILPNGDVSMARLVTRDISYSGTIVGTNPNTCNVIGGVTLCNGNVILTGTATNSNLLVPGWIRNTDPATQLDISGGNISNSLTTRSSNFRASAGTAGVPAYSFASDPSTGLHWAGTSQLAFDTSGVQRMVISNGNVGIGKTNPVVALDVSGDISANVYNGPGGTQGAPHYTFSDDRTTGLFFPGANIVGLTAGGTERMRISNAAIGIGTTAPTNALDVSGTLRVIGTAGDLTFSNGSIRLGGATLISSTGVLSNANTTSNIIGGVTLNTTDISMTTGGRILGVAATSNTIGGITLSNSNLIAGGFLRNALVATQFDISGGNISNSATHISSNFIGTAGASNSIGGVVLSNSDLSMNSAGRILAPILRNALVPSTYDISGGNISNSGVHTTAGLVGTYLRNALAPSTYDISGGNISNSLTTTSSNFIGTAAASNSIGGVVLSNSDLSMNSAGRILAPILRNALVPSTYDISGGNISNSGTHISSNFVGTAAASNSIGGVVLSNSDLSMNSAGRILAPILRNALVPTTYDISGGNISNSGVHISSNFLAAPGGAPRPAYAFTTDPSSGLDLVRTSYLAFDTSGVQRMCISGDLVGIGTAAPAFTLDISSAGTYGVHIRNPAPTGNIGLRLSNGFGGTGDLGVAGGNGSWTGGALAGDTVLRANCNFHVETKAATRMSVTDVGVGIGTNTPAAALDVSGGVVRVQRIYNGLANAFVIADSTGTLATRWGLGILNTATGSGSGGNDFMINAYDDAGAFTQPLTIKRSNGFVGIRMTAPAYALDVCGVGHFRNPGSNSGQIELGDPAGTLFLLRDQAGNGYLRPQSDATMYIGASNLNTMNIRPNAVGINLAGAPGYALDVTSTATTAAALNLSTWPRYAVSTTHMVKVRTGNASTATLSVVWPAPAISLNANLGTVTNDSVNGTYFVCKRSGLWSISTSLHGNGPNPTYIIDVSNNITYNDAITINSSRMIAGTLGGYYYATVTFTGYLPSNDNLYYKFRCGGLGPDTLASYLYISFHHELPAATGFPYG